MMNKIISLFSLLFLGLSSLSAQSFIGKINPYPVERTTQQVQNDTVKIIAVLVEFQEDRDAATFGNGKFGSIYSKDYGLDILDPLPHNASYFRDHLEFAKNYFSKVSGEKQVVEYTVLENVLTLSQTMRNYSPPANSNDLNSLGSFAQEVWSLAAQTYPDVNFSDYNLFTIFHAGVGRDIRVPGSLGLERDLPSVYLSFNALKNIFGNQFTGFDVNGSVLTNTLILPSTESRELAVIGGTVLLELTINGLIAASIGSHIGLPDLFDTETGLSAIGRFGLMDGQSIFAYSGVFPPEPSPWEKIYLGWQTPITAENNNQTVSITAKNAAALSDTTILKVPINSTEYYLVENRARDAGKDGAIVTYKVGEKILTKTFEKDTTGFQSFETDSLAGVITDVDEYDWALPGNGIVIWHIDENIINRNIANNSINNDKFMRGVDVEEADGIQDIGEEFQSIFGDIIVGEGTEDDFWFASNESDLYQNKFGSATLPNTNSNSGGESLIEFSNFSEISNRMTFDLKFGTNDVKLLLTSRLDPIQGDYNYFNSVRVGQSLNYYLTSEQTKRIYKYDENGVLVNNFEFSDKKPAVVEKPDGALFFGAKDSMLTMFGENGSGVTQLNFSAESSLITSSPVVFKVDAAFVSILLGTNKGEVVQYDVSNDYNFTIINRAVVFQTQSNQPIDQIISDGNLIAAVSGKSIVTNTGDIILLDADVKFAALTKSGENVKLVCLTSGNRIYVYQNGTKFSEFVIGGSEISSFIMTDIAANGENYIVLNSSSNLIAYTLNGSIAEGFPFSDASSSLFTLNPLSVDLNGDSKGELLSFSDDGRLFVFDPAQKRTIDPFPVSTGVPGRLYPVLFNDNGATKFALLTEQNDLNIWSIRNQNSTLYWSDLYGNSSNSSSVEAASNAERITEFFPENKAYNWPNPVYGDETFIRYYVSENSQVEIKIFDLAGDLAAELTDTAVGGFDNETAWNVTDIQSGVYLAHLDIKGGSGNTAHKIIKIAVIK